MTCKFELTPSIVRYLQTIERVRETVRLTVLPPAVAEVLRFQANIRAALFDCDRGEPFDLKRDRNGGSARKTVPWPLNS